MKITLHTPHCLDDVSSTTEFEANDIVHIESVKGRKDPNDQGARFWLKGINEHKFCLESVNELRRMVEENKTIDEIKPMYSIGQIGDTVNQKGFNINQKIFGGGLVVVIITGVIANFIFAALTR